MSRLCEVFDLRIFNLKKERSLLGIRIKLLSHTVPRPPNLNRFLHINLPLMRLRLSRSIFGFTSSTFSEIGLMTFSLSMSEVVTFVVVKSETEFTFITTEMIAHEIGIFC